jgi:hypothetical protein
MRKKWSVLMVLLPSFYLDLTAKSLDVGVKYNTYCLKGSEMEQRG